MRPNAKETDVVSGFRGLYEFLRDFDENAGLGPACDADTALYNLKLIHSIKMSADAGNSPVKP